MSDARRARPCCRAQLLDEVAVATGMPLETVRWIADAIRFTGAYRRRAFDTAGISAGELCRMLVADIDARDAAGIRMTLERLGISSSRDIGRIVYSLIDVDLCRQSDGDRQVDFDGVFETADIETYLRSSGVDHLRDVPMLLKSAVVWMFYLGGLGLWVGRSLVSGRSVPVWFGGALIGIGWLVYRLPYPKPMRFGWPWSTLERRLPGGNDSNAT